MTTLSTSSPSSTSSISSTGQSPTTAPDLRPLHRRVINTSVQIVNAVRPIDLARRTPCADWTLADLLAHMTAQHRGFAAAAQGDGADLRHWQPQPAAGLAWGPAADPVSSYTQASAEVLAAFAGITAQQSFSLPEFSTEITFPAQRAVGFHVVDYVVHSWDVARSIGRPASFDDEVLAVALQIAEAVPAGSARTAPGAAFAPVLDSALDTSQATLTRVLALLGRSADWTAD